MPLVDVFIVAARGLAGKPLLRNVSAKGSQVSVAACLELLTAGNAAGGLLSVGKGLSELSELTGGRTGVHGGLYLWLVWGAPVWGERREVRL